MGKSPGLTLSAAIVQDNVPIEVAPRVFVGSMHAAFNVDALKEKNISHIVNLTGNYATFPDDFTYLSITIRDKEYANLLSCLPVALLFVEVALTDSSDEERGVLIHCAGGRSRSPAVATAYLMTKYHLTFDEAVARIRLVRPVVSLNAGFEAQLRCLEKADGDIFMAHQLMLQHKLASIIQQRNDGLLDIESSRLKPSSLHSSRRHRLPKTPRTKDSDGIDHAAACDDRGMIHGTVPSGFSLSLSDSLSKGQLFIPTLRSMGALYGCRACGENLFCASSVLDHCQSKDRHAQLNPRTKTLASETKTKRPLLAKLRLRPHSPSVKGASQSVNDVGTTKSNPTTPRLAVLKSVIKPVDKDSTPTSPHLQQQPQPSELPKSSSASDLEASIRSKEDQSRANSGSLWRSLTSFKMSAKRAVNELDEEKKKKAVMSPKAIDLSREDEDIVHLKFIQDNIKQWQHKLTQLELSWTGLESTGPKSSMALSTQLSELIARDTNTISCLEGPDRLYIAPISWLLRSNLEHDKGTIICPNDQCRAVLGQWQWEGIACPCGCGHVVLPAFAMDKCTLRQFGTVVEAPVVAGDSTAYNGGGAFRGTTDGPQRNRITQAY